MEIWPNNYVNKSRVMFVYKRKNINVLFHGIQ